MIKMIKPKNRWMLLLYVVVGAVVLYFGIIRPVQVRFEKAQFEKAASQIQELSNQIAAKVGQPDQTAINKGCDYASRVYFRGPLACSVSNMLLFENTDSERANQILEDTYAILGDRPSRFVFDNGGIKTTYDSFIDAKEYQILRPTNGIVNQTFESSLPLKPRGMSCGFYYTYPVTNAYRETFQLTSTNNLMIELRCTGDALATYYPVQD